MADSKSISTASGVGARENPFRSERIEALAFRPQGTDLPTLLGRLLALQFCAAIVGPKGSGKTTLLEELARRLEGEGRRAPLVRLSEERRRPEPGRLDALAREAGPETVVLLDGAEQLGALAWWRLRRAVRRAGGLVITSHRAGRLPTLIETRTSPALLAELLGELRGEAQCELGRDEVERLFKAAEGNLREAFRRLYREAAGG